MDVLCHMKHLGEQINYQNVKIKMEPRLGGDQRQSTATPSGPAIPITTLVTANEYWRGKNDPAERRRIQNRLNQRAFRQRQRAGEPSKQYKPRSTSSASDDEDEDEDSSSSDDEAESPELNNVTPFRQYGEDTTTTGGRPDGTRDPRTGRIWDELAQLINRNFMTAVVANAQHLGLDISALRSTTPLMTPRPSGRHVTASLQSVELQYQVAHDPVIDTIPHARLRYNILRAIATRQINATVFSQSIRGSGSLAASGDSWHRSGLVVWSSPESISSWELSENFVNEWAVLLQGCEDLIAATNAWRTRRGERTFQLRSPNKRT